ncbi:MAG TPA: hypothetical protein VNW54_10275 [Granulicella sp.]|jgi:hypothetical protein|nr:hypothetical protein [Granulicella sp.]
MKTRLTFLVSVVAISGGVCALAFALPEAAAQNPPMEQKVAEIKQASAANKQALARYTWQEQQVISLKGEVKKTVSYQVSVGLDGQQQKIELGSSAAPPPTGGRLKQHIVAKKRDEFQEYGQQVAALTKQYTQPDPQLLQQAYQQGNTSIQLGGAPGTVTLVIKNYLKPGDSMTLVFDEGPKTIQTLQIASYLSDPKDAVTIAVQFAKLPAGVNHVAAAQINGVSKQMTVAIQNFNYQLSQM